MSKSGNPKQITPRLQKMIDYLKDGLWHTTWDIATATGDRSETKTISLLRKFGYRIETEYRGTNINGRRVYHRRMLAF